jgi:hypothetical protein
MKKILGIIVLGLLWFAPVLADDYKWEISSMNEGQTVLARMNGNVTHGDTLIFILRNQNGKCGDLTELFTFYTAANNPSINEIEQKIIPIKVNGDSTHALANNVSPFLIGHRVMFSMGTYNIDTYISLISKWKIYDLIIVDETNPKSAEQSNMIENFKAEDYFDIPNNSWNLEGAKEAILKAQKLCLEYKETKKSITEIKKVTKTYSDGSKYIGEIKDDLPNGQGTYTSSDGRKYVGEWKNGKTDGQGTSTLPDGSEYVGEFKDGKMNGKGTWTGADGKKYVGDYKADKRHGQGTLTWTNGKKYVGEWRDDKENGQGTYTWPDGSIYIGGWKDGNYSGQGTFKQPNGTKYVGEWKDDKSNGQGTMTRTDGTKYVGEWKDGKANGIGTWTWPDGRKHVGVWKDNKQNGLGTTILPDGTKYVGEWKEGKKITSESNESVTVKTNGTNEKKYSLFGVFIGDDVNDYQPSNKDYIPHTFIIQPPKPNKDFILYYAGIDKKNNNIVWIGGIHKKNYPLGNQLTTKKMLSVAKKCMFENKEYVRMIAKGKQFEEFNYDMNDFNERPDNKTLNIFDGDKVDYSNKNIKFTISIDCINKDGTIIKGEEVGARAHIKLFDYRNLDQLAKEEEERIKNEKDNSGLN